MSAEDEAFIAKTLAALDASANARRDAALAAVATDLEAPNPADAAFVDRVMTTVDQHHLAAREATLERVLADLAPKRAHDPVLPFAGQTARSRWLTRQVFVAVALAASLAAVITWVATQPGAPESPFAFGGNPTAGAVADIERDAHGRIAAIGQTRAGKPEGERLVFRAGQLVRIEHWRNGVLDGVTIDLDARGRIVQSRTWVEGRPRGPWVDFGEDGGVRASGDAP